MKTFYENADILDKLKELRKPTAKQIETVVKYLKKGSYSRYFFHELENPAWLEPLEQKRIFVRLPEPIRTPEGYIVFQDWPPSQYLVRVAKEKPDNVARIIQKIDAEDPFILKILMEAVLNMAPDQAAKLQPAVIRWLEKKIVGLPHDAAKFMRYMGENDYWQEALQIMQILTEPVLLNLPKKKRYYIPPEAFPWYERYAFEKILEEDVVALAKRKPLEVVILLENQLTKCIELEYGASVKYRPEGDRSPGWRAAIEDHPQDLRHESMKAILLEALRDSLVDLSTDEPFVAKLIIERYLRHSLSIFRRLAVHVIRVNSKYYQDLVKKLFSERRNLSDLSIHHEFFKFMEDCFSSVSKDIQSRFLQWILEGPDERELARWETEQDRARYKNRWILDRLWMLKSHLRGEYKKRLIALEKELAKPKHPEFAIYITTTPVVGPLSPTKKNKLVKKGPGGIINYLKTWEANRQFGAPTPEGLGRVLGEVVEEEPTKFAKIADRFLEKGISPTYHYHVLEGLRSAWKEGKNFDWTKVIRLCEGLISRRDAPSQSVRGIEEVDYKGVRRAVADLIGEGLRDSDHAISQDVTKVRDILLKLVEDPDPTLEEEQELWKDTDPVTISLNTVRGKAMRALIIYALHHARVYFKPEDRQSKLEPETKQVLTRKVDIRKESSVAIHSIFGEFLPNLFYLDKKWVSEHIGDIFPQKPEQEKYWNGAWEAYISYNRLYRDIYEPLRPQYESAVSKLTIYSRKQVGRQEPPASLAGHLMVAYLWGLEEIVGKKNYLLPIFFSKASDSIRAHAIWFLGQVLENDRFKGSSKEWRRMKKLWRARTKASKKGKGHFAEELSNFAWWLRAVPEGLVTLHSLIEAIIPHFGQGWPWSEVLRFLSKETDSSPGFAMRLLYKLLKQHPKIKAHQIFQVQRDQIRSILSAAIRSDEENAQVVAEKAINVLGEQGYYEYRELLKS